MSWSISFVGTPEKISEALIAHSDKVSGQSKQEFEEALPHLKALVESNTQGCFQVIANGHAQFTDGKKTYGYLNVKIEQLPGFLV